jgi:hypothetical protein
LNGRFQVLHHFAALDIDSLYQQLYSPAPTLEVEVVPGRSLDERERLLPRSHPYQISSNWGW